MFQRVCWQMIHTLPHSCSTGTLAPRLEMDHLFSGLNFETGGLHLVSYYVL